MGANTKIEWCDFTFNPWRGCQKVAAGCVNCYAEAQSKRNPKTLGVWGPNGTRVVASEEMWRQPLKWERDVETTVEVWKDDRPRVFCGSLCDVFEDWGGEIRGSSGGVMWDAPGLSWQEQMLPGRTDGIMRDGGGRRLTLADARARLFRLIDSTQSLDWLLLTKRPENVRRMLPIKTGRRDAIKDGRANIDAWRRENVWLGTSIACQEDADRNVPELLKCRDLCAKTVLSIEPLIGPVDLDECWPGGMPSPGRGPYVPGVDWVIVGGESGPNARPCDIAWIRSIVRQCKYAGVPCFVKQLGARVLVEEYAPHDWPDGVYFSTQSGLDDDMDNDPSVCDLRDPKGGDPAEWPEDVRVREVP